MMMELPAGGMMVVGNGNVPAFLMKLWTLVEDPETDPHIRWSPSGTSFHVLDQGHFAKEILPKFFKHNNMASFIRQLNMYGFRKVVHIEQGGLLKPEKDDTEFAHPFFIKDHEHLLENIKRKVTNVRSDEMKISPVEVNKILSDVQMMRGKQESIDSRIVTMKLENEALWRELASLRQKHVQQQKVVNKLIQFLVGLLQTNRVLGVKRKIPLMLNDSTSPHSLPKYSRPLSLEHPQNTAGPIPADSPVNSGPIISDITEISASTEEDAIEDLTDLGGSSSFGIKEEPISPNVEACSVLEEEAPTVDTPLSPTTFFNSILQEEIQPTPVTSSTAASTAASSVVVASPASVPLEPIVQSPASVASTNSASDPVSSTLPKKCQTIACIDRFPVPPTAGGHSPEVWRVISALPDKSELSDHVDSIDNGLENLQSFLNGQTFTFDTSSLMEFFNSPNPSAEFDFESLDNLLSDDAPKENEGQAGKQLVQYTLTPVQLSEPVVSFESSTDLPSLLELEEEPFLIADTTTDDPTQILLGNKQTNCNL